MTAADFQSKVSQLSILDIRTPHEWADFNLGGIHIPLDVLLERISELDKKQHYIVICYNGLQSVIACRLLAAKGFSCENLEGGLEEFLSV